MHNYDKTLFLQEVFYSYHTLPSYTYPERERESLVLFGSFSSSFGSKQDCCDFEASVLFEKETFLPDESDFINSCWMERARF